MGSSASDDDSPMERGDFAIDRHVAYFKECLASLPGHYRTMDTNRLTLMYFSLSGLDLLDALDTCDKERALRYIYSQQACSPHNGGFYGYPKVHFESDELDQCHNQPHIANTYTALVMLLMLGDDLQRVNREAIAHSLRKWQLPDGSFCCVHGVSNLDSESDMRFVYCAACICYILDLWESVDLDLMFAFIMKSRSYDYAFGMGPFTESHGGCTYCALAALSMMGCLSAVPCQSELIEWLAKRQHLGFQGRVKKPIDSCYSFWVGASLWILGVPTLMDGDSCARFLKSCEKRMGGFSKFPETRFPDLLHSYFSVAGLSLCGLLGPMHVLLNISQRACGTSQRFHEGPGIRQ